MVHRTSFITVVFVLAAAGAHAQETLPQAPPSAPPTPTAPAAATAPRPGTPTQGVVPNLQRIYHIRQLEGMLTNAVRAGAAALASQLKVAEPNSLFVTGSGRTRGFELEGYGVFFDVDVPTMMQSVAWSTLTLQQQQYINFLQRSLADPSLDEKGRRMANFELQRVQRAMANGQIAQVPVMPPPPAPAAPGMVVGATTDAGPVPAPVASRVESAPIPDPRTPDELYTETIKGALIDAMLSYGNALQLGDDEWLTIAARATTQGQPGQGIDDSSSILLRVRGSDLSAFLKGKMSREDVVKKIEIKEG
jgi:hypothetical protein